jgi:DNA-binding SARP family transcriptional activator/tetratricopeptide (TPR) repeat protein
VEARVQFRVLGPLDVRCRDVAVPLGGTRQRELMALLLVHRNAVVSKDRLADELWGERAGADAGHALQALVSRLRSALGPVASRLVTRSPGYLLEVGDDELDAERFERLCADAHLALEADDPARADADAGRAHALWRGPPYAEFTYAPFAQAEIAKLTDMRAACAEDQIEARLQLGRHAEVLPTLRRLVSEHPLRERLRAQLMLALYRSGRQADALALYRETHRVLDETLGIDPGPVLQELQQRILCQDPTLQSPGPPPARIRPTRDSPGPPPATQHPDRELPVAPPQAVSPTADAGATAVARRPVTVLAVRLSGHGRGGDADPELQHRALRAARERLALIAARYGGKLLPGAGTELRVVFGLVAAHEDDALRALSAADDLRAGTAARDSRRVGVAAGVDAGEVVCDAADGDAAVVGAPLTGASTLAARAGDGDVLLSDASRRLAPDAIRADAVPALSAWRLREVIPGAPPFRRRFDVPLIGRDAELSAACRAFDRAVAAGETRLLTVLGEAGIGKSRLAEELVTAVAEHATVLRGRCVSYRAQPAEFALDPDGIALWPLREALSGLAGDESRDAIRALLDGMADADQVADVVAGALGLGATAGKAEQVPWAFRRLLEALAASRPLVFVIDDAHWAEPPLLELLEDLVDWLAGAPLLIVCLARPELVRMRPTLAEPRLKVDSIVLAPLDEPDARRFLERQRGGERLSAQERDEILRTAAGNPLFAEQLLAMRADAPRTARERPIPTTVQALLAARLDQLGPGQRACIERAALVGREFWLGAVVEMLPHDARSSAREHIGALIRSGLVRPCSGTLPGEEALRFHHILIRDVAYSGISKQMRGELHAQVADWLDRHSTGLEEFVGYHLEVAFRYREELQEVDDAGKVVAARAARQLAVAGRRALARGDVNAGERLLDRAAHLARRSEHAMPEVFLDLGSALTAVRRFNAAGQALEVAKQALEVTPTWAAADRQLLRLVELERARCRFLSESGPGVTEVQRAARLVVDEFTSALGAAASDDRRRLDAGLARALSSQALACFMQCSCAQMEDTLDAALRHAKAADDRRAVSEIHAGRARATLIGSRHIDDGVERCREILVLAADDIPLAAVSEAILAVLEALRGSYGVARGHWQRCARRLQDSGLPAMLDELQMYGGFVELRAGTPQRAEADLRRACEALQDRGERPRLSSTSAVLARVLHAQGRDEEAERFAALTKETAAADDAASQIMWRATSARLLARRGRIEEALERIDEAVLRAERTDFVLLQADTLVDRADVLVQAGRLGDAEPPLDDASRRYAEKGVCVAMDALRQRLGILADGGAYLVRQQR